MKTKIYDLINKCQPIGIHEIASKLEIEEREALRIVDDLQSCGYVGIKAVALNISDNESCFYITTTKKYE